MNKLIVVDFQNDFISGTLPVPGAEDITPGINGLITCHDEVIFTMDWHPEDHCSFDTFPSHCVAGTKGADLHHRLEIPQKCQTIRKGMSKYRDEFSPHADTFIKAGIVAGDRVTVCGVALEYCVVSVAQTLNDLCCEVLISLAETRAITRDIQPVLEELLEEGISFV